MFRMFVVKVVFAIRVDVLGEDINVELGMEYRVMLEKRMRLLEEGKVGNLGVLGFIFSLILVFFFNVLIRIVRVVLVVSILDI